jgi:hypothetical protein
MDSNFTQKDESCGCAMQLKRQPHLLIFKSINKEYSRSTTLPAKCIFYIRAEQISDPFIIIPNF